MIDHLSYRGGSSDWVRCRGSWESAVFVLVFAAPTPNCPTSEKLFISLRLFLSPLVCAPCDTIRTWEMHTSWNLSIRRLQDERAIIWGQSFCNYASSSCKSQITRTFVSLQHVTLVLKMCIFTQLQYFS